MVFIILVIIVAITVIYFIAFETHRDTKKMYLCVIDKQAKDKLYKVKFMNNIDYKTVILYCNHNQYDTLLNNRCYNVTHRNGRVIKIDTDWRDRDEI